MSTKKPARKAASAPAKAAKPAASASKAKPATSKGLYLRKVALSSTMGLGVRIDTQTIAA